MFSRKSAYCDAVVLSRIFVERLVEPPEAKCSAAGLVNLDDCAAEAHWTPGDREVSRQAIHEAFNYRLGVAAQARVVGTAHPDVANKRRPARENALIGCLHMGMRPKDRRDLPVEESAHCNFLAGRLGVHVHDDNGSLLSQLFDFVHGGMEGIVQNGLHKGAALDIEDGYFALGGFQDEAPLPWRPVRVVDRAQQTRLRGNVRGGFSLIPDVIACRDDCHPAAKEVDCDPTRDSTPARRVFAVHNDKIYVALLEKHGNGFHDGAASGLADDVTQE